jgi:hypothetical protein
MANQAKVSWTAAEVLTTGDVDAARVAWHGVEALTTADADLSRVGWFGVEVLTLAGVNQARVSWLAVEALSTAPFLIDTEVECPPNTAVAVNVSTGWTQVVVRTPWLVVWSATHAVLVADSPSSTARLIPGGRPVVLPIAPGRAAVHLTAAENTVVTLECRWNHPFGYRRGLGFGRRTPLG